MPTGIPKKKNLSISYFHCFNSGSQAGSDSHRLKCVLSREVEIQDAKLCAQYDIRQMEGFADGSFHPQPLPSLQSKGNGSNLAPTGTLR